MDVSGIFDGIARVSAQAIREESGDYVKDGLLYCGRCNTPKQCKVNLLGESATVFCLCRCMAEAQKAAEAERIHSEHLRRLDKMRRTGFPEADMMQWTFERDDGANSKLSTVAKRYVENFDKLKDDGKGLLLYGGVGTGKTFAAACIANALIDQGHSCFVSSITRIINVAQNNEQSGGKQAYLDNLNRFELLVLDDLASERDTEYMLENVQAIIDARYRTRLPLIVTTNLTSDELKHPEDMRKQRIYSRIFEMCIPVEVTGEDRRKRKLVTDYNAYRDLLGL